MAAKSPKPNFGADAAYVAIGRVAKLHCEFAGQQYVLRRAFDPSCDTNGKKSSIACCHA